MKKFKFIFIGTSEFAAIIIDNLIKNKWQPLLVITQPDKKTGRNQIFTSSPVKLITQKNKIKILSPKKIIEVKSQIINVNPEFIIVSSYGQILPSEILNLPPFGCLNVHPSLLPLYRGPSPIQAAILNGDKKTGVTILKMDEKIDHGPILAKEKITIDKNDTTPSLSKKMAELSSKLIIKTVPLWLENKIQTQTQDEKRASYTKIIDKKDSLIDWRGNALEIEHQVRAFLPWPGSYTFWQNKQLKIIKAKIYSDNFELEPGRVFKTEDNEIAVATSKKALIVKKLQIEGKNPAEDQDFLRGYPQIIGSILH